MLHYTEIVFFVGVFDLYAVITLITKQVSPWNVSVAHASL